MQLDNASDNEIQDKQKELNELYDKFVKKYGLINSRGNASVFSNDGSYFLLCSLEVLDENGNLKADIAQEDGYHLKSAGYTLWVDYLRTHTVG